MEDWKTLFTEQEIQVRIKQLAKQISEDYKDKDLLIIGVLKGACIFFSDLIRLIDTPLAIDFFIVSSYSGQESSGNVEIHFDLREDVKGKDILIVDDIIDTGLTLKRLKECLKEKSPRSIKACALLDKKTKRQVEVEADYIGFEVPDLFAVGYGMDYKNKFRNLPFIAEFKSNK